MKKKFADGGMPGAFSPMSPSMAAQRQQQKLAHHHQQQRLAEQQRQSQQQPLTHKQRQQLQQPRSFVNGIPEATSRDLAFNEEMRNTYNTLIGNRSSGATTPTARPSAPAFEDYSPSLIGQIPETTPQDLAFRQQKEAAMRSAMDMVGGIGSSGATNPTATTPTARPSAPAPTPAASSGASWGGTNPTASPQPAAAQPASTANWGGAPGSVFRKGGKVKAYAKGGMISSASRRGDGIATKGKTRGKMC